MWIFPYTQTFFNDDEVVKKIQSLNDCQHKIFAEIKTAVSGDNEKKLFFIDGPGGTGKSYLLNTLITFLIIKIIKAQQLLGLVLLLIC